MKHIFNITLPILLALLSSCSDIVYAQGQTAFSPGKILLYTNGAVPIQNRKFATGQTDTTAPIQFVKYGAVQLFLQTKDSSTILIAVQLSYDSVTYSSPVTLDSLTQKSDGSVVKQLELSGTILGAPWGRFIFTFSPNSFPIGVTTPTYSAAIKVQNNAAYNNIQVPSSDTLINRLVTYWQSIPYGTIGSFNKPNDTLTFGLSGATNVSIGTAWTPITGVAAQNGGGFFIDQLTLSADSNNVTGAAFQIWICSDTTKFPSFGHNANFKDSSAVSQSLVAIVPFFFQSLGLNSTSTTMRCQVPVTIKGTTAANTTSLFYRLEFVAPTGTLWKSALGEKFTLQVQGLRHVKS